MDSSPFPSFFHPITTAWFRRRFGEPSPPQQLGWPLIAKGKNTLILAPTGSGKTLAAFLACIDTLVWELLASQAPDARRQTPVGAEAAEVAGRPSRKTGAHRLASGASPGVRILYISPLKALNYDIEKNLREPLEGLREEAERQGIALPEIRVGVRTGDTRSKERQQMVRKPPHILITTPKSLHLILTSQAKSMLETVQFLILDEIHALCNNKRGVFTALLLERLEELRSGVRGQGSGVSFAGVRGQGSGDSSDLTPDPRPLTPPLVRIGLSATQRPLEEVARFLGGAEWMGEELVARPVEIVDAGMRKRLSLQVLSPVDDLAHLEAGTLWPGITGRLLGLVHGKKSTIIFANNRRQVERLTAQLNEAAREEIALPHHGSIAAGVRKQTEERLKRGEVRAVCATGTLELGIDMGAVELVCQVESPRQVSKGLQRVGRAGHLMSAVSEGRILAKQPLDLLEAAVLGREMLAGRVESLHVPQNCLDVLAQQLVAIVADGERSLDDLYRLARQAYPYRELSEKQFQGTVAMISGRYPSHLFKDLQARVSLDRVKQRLLPLPGTRRSALTNGGTIPDTGQFGVYISDGRVKLGELDEEFIYESRSGDVFSLGIDTWRIDRIEADRVLVSPAPGQPARMPFWRGESYGREPELGRAMGEFVAEAGARLDDADVEEWIREQVPVDETAAHNIAAYLRAGREKCGALPTHQTLLVESFADEIGERRLAVLSTLGRRVHLTLRLALAALIQERYGVDPEALHNDDGLLLRLPGGEAELPLDLLRQLQPEAVWDLVVRQLGSSPLFGLRFRQNAARALLLPGARPGKRTPLWLQRLKAKDLLAVAGEYDDFPIVLETYRECLEEFLAIDAARELLEGLRDGSVQAVEVRRDSPSPFVASLLFDFQAVYMYEWDRPKKIGRGATEAQQRLVADLVGHLRSATALLDQRTVAEREARLQGTAPDARARTPAEFLELLRRLGDLPADGEAVAARYTGDADDLLRTLCADRLVVQVPLPNANHRWHWILTEEWALYRDAFLSRVQGERSVPVGADPKIGAEPGGSPAPTTDTRSSDPAGPAAISNCQGACLRVDGDRELPLEDAVPAVFREEEGEAEPEVTRQEEARRFIVRRYVLHRMLTSTAEVAAWYGLTNEETETILRDLESLGAIISIPTEAPDETVRSGTREAGDGHQVIRSSLTRWASPEHLEGAYAATLARRRREARPATVAQYQQFLLAWQHRAGAPLAGDEGVRQVLAQLQGLPLPATVWEGEVLARRVKPYQAAWLDHACQTGEFVWQGSGGSFSGRGRVAFFQRELFPHWPAQGECGVRSAEFGMGADEDGAQPELLTPNSALRTRVAEVLARRGASFLLDLALATGSDSRSVAAALWELIWQGRVTHDQWSVIRAGPPARGSGSSFGEALGGRLAGRAPGQRPLGRLPRPQFSSTGRGQREALPGRYAWLAALRFDEHGEEERGTWRSEVADLVARQLLERYGVVARELLELEAIPLPWGLLYDALHLMELTGEIQRGYFVEGFTGAQFGLPRAVEELKRRQEGRGAGAASFVLLNACDPANVYGGAARAPEPGEGEEERSLLRLPSNYLVLRNGAPALLLETGARRLSPLQPLAGEELEAACAALRELVEHPWPLRTVRQPRLERWGERPIRGSAAEAALRALGFSLSPKGLEL